MIARNVLRFAFALVLGSTACTAEDLASPSGTTVTVEGNTFAPGTITIKVGETVKWKWGSSVHNVVSGKSCSPDGRFSSGDPVAGGTFEQQFTTAGTYDYFCSVHCAAGMVGQVVVQ